MHPTVHYQLAQAKIADLHRQAERDALARAARRERHTRRHQPSPSRPRSPGAVTRQVLAVLGIRSL